MTVPLSWDSTDEDEDGAIAPSDGAAGGPPPPASAGVAGAGGQDWIRRMLQSSSEVKLLDTKIGSVVDSHIVVLLDQ